MHRKSPNELKKMAKAWSGKAKDVFSLVCVLDYVELLLRECVTMLTYPCDCAPSRTAAE
jgi:hypothetical protein